MGLTIPFVGAGPLYNARGDFATSDDLRELLIHVQRRAVKETGYWSRRAHDWGTASVTLAVLSTLGSGAAGATAVASSLSSSSARSTVAILAFAGAALAGVAAAVGAPSQFQSASKCADSFSALERWASLSVVEFPRLNDEQRIERVREILAWRDEILGVTTPSTLSSGRDVAKPDGA
ncbi:MAG: hypothetical protein KGJ10_06145 [Acidobacteriota bacterium]|nr:hypothetical protein [Acidobacteriota bacterium]MDE3044390.1 hypothetical protein [Acidobacteriota bacterium]MDE3223538.1 hypothetical protein [Acidobacteriota bacterium]